MVYFLPRAVSSLPSLTRGVRGARVLARHGGGSRPDPDRCRPGRFRRLPGAAGRESSPRDAASTELTCAQASAGSVSAPRRDGRPRRGRVRRPLPGRNPGSARPAGLIRTCCGQQVAAARGEELPRQCRLDRDPGDRAGFSLLGRAAIREHRLIQYGSATGRERDMAEVGLAAYTTAHGKPASWPDPWSAHFETSAAPAPAVRRVRVVEIGLLDGSCAVLFEGTPEEAEGLYRTHTHDRIRAVSSGRSADPGTVCGDCKLITACDSLPRLPGLLGISDPAAPLRRWSVTNGRHYDRCPAQDHLLRLHLPKENEYGPEAVRGQAVHEWLATNHGGGFNAVCTIWDIPPVPDDWTGGRWHVTGDQARYGAQMLASHADVCPFHRSGQITQVRVEPELTFHDAAANVVVTARPDLMYTDDGAGVG